MLFRSTALIFAGTEILPGDVASAVLGQSATEELKAALRAQMGLDRPMLTRYFDWLGRILSGDLGVSLANGFPVDGLVAPRVLNTLYLAIVTAVIAVPLASALGLLSAAFPDSLFDRVVNAVTLFMVSIPDFLIAIILIIIFSVEMRWFPMMLKRVDFSDFGGAGTHLGAQLLGSGFKDVRTDGLDPRPVGRGSFPLVTPAPQNLGA